MSGPTDAEIAALLAMPDGAREALKGCAGAFWCIQPHPEGLHSHHVLARWRKGWAGEPLPCNPLEIVRVAGERAGSPAFHIQFIDDDGWRAVILGASDEELIDAAAEGPTPHLAALALLAAVWEE
jgi:hypothetical protein